MTWPPRHQRLPVTGRSTLDVQIAGNLHGRTLFCALPPGLDLGTLEVPLRPLLASHRLVGWHPRGTGRSVETRPQALTPHDHLEDAVALLRALLPPGAPWDVWAWSCGASIAARVMEEVSGAERVVLVAPAHAEDVRGGGALDGLGDIRGWQAEDTRNAARRVADRLREVSPGLLREIAQAWLALRPRRPLAGRTIVLCGAQDVHVAPSGFSRWIRDPLTALVTVPLATHSLPIELGEYVGLLAEDHLAHEGVARQRLA